MDYYRINDRNRYYHLRHTLYGNDSWNEDEKFQVSNYDARIMAIDDDEHLNDSGTVDDYSNKSDKSTSISFEMRTDRPSDSSYVSTEPEDIETRI